MAKRKPCPYTDEDILTMGKVTGVIAAKYLGMTYDMLCWQMRQDALNGTDKIPFGKALHRRQWSYRIFPEALVKYKNGFNPKAEATVRAEIMELFNKLGDDERNQVKGYMQALLTYTAAN